MHSRHFSRRHCVAHAHVSERLRDGTFVLVAPSRRHSPHRKHYYLNAVGILIFYCLLAQQRVRHDQPFNKRAAGAQRRATRRFVLQQKELPLCSN